MRAGLAQRPPGITWRHLAGGGALAGIGFTMSLFIANLGLDGGALTAARTGILLGSAAAAGLGAAVLLIGGTDDNDAQ